MNFDFSPREKELARLGRDFTEQVLFPLEEITDQNGELPMDRRANVCQQVRYWGLAGINQSH